MNSKHILATYLGLLGYTSVTATTTQIYSPFSQENHTDLVSAYGELRTLGTGGKMYSISANGTLSVQSIDPAINVFTQDFGQSPTYVKLVRQATYQTGTFGALSASGAPLSIRQIKPLNDQTFPSSWYFTDISNNAFRTYISPENVANILITDQAGRDLPLKQLMPTLQNATSVRTHYGFVIGPDGYTWGLASAVDAQYINSTELVKFRTDGTVFQRISLPTAKNCHSLVNYLGGTVLAECTTSVNGTDTDTWIKSDGQQVLGSYPIPSQVQYVQSSSLGPDGKLWFIGDRDGIYSMNASGTIQREASNPFRVLPSRIAPGTDGRMWVLGRINSSDPDQLLALGGLNTTPAPNDNFASRIALSGTMGAASGSSYLATGELNEPQHAGAVARHSLWWSWTAPASGQLLLNTFGSAPSAAVAIYQGDTLSNLVKVPASTFRDSAALVAKVSAGVNYKIAIDQFYSIGGFSVLNYNLNTKAATDLSTNTSIQNSPSTGHISQITATVANVGTDFAIGNTLLLTFNADLVAKNVPANCSLTGPRSMRCTMEGLTPGANRIFQIPIEAGQSSAAQPISMTAQVTSQTPDNNILNNATTVVDESYADTPIPAWALMGISAGLYGAIRKKSKENRNPST